MRSVALVALILIAAIGLYVMLGEETALPDAQSGAVSAADPAEERRPPADLAEAEENESATEPIPAEDREALEAAPAETLEESPEAAVAREFSGRVILTDEQDLQHDSLSGSIRLILWSANIGDHETVDVVDGRFTVDARNADNFSVMGATLGQYEAISDDPGERYDEEGDPVVVRVHLPRVLRLSVISEESGAHLTNVRVVSARDWSLDSHGHPGTQFENLLAEGANSPVELRRPTRRTFRNLATCFVHSPGFAWKAVKLDLNWGGAREVRLVAGGNLEVSLSGTLPSGNQHIRLFAMGNSEPMRPPFAEAPATIDSIAHFEGLPPGTYFVNVEAGSWYQTPVLLGRATAVIEVDRTTSCEVVLAPLAEVQRADVSGVLVLPAAWDIESFVLTVRANEANASGRGNEQRKRSGELIREGDEWAFRFEDLPIGDFRFEFRSEDPSTKLEFAQQLVVGPEGKEGIRVEIGAPADVVVLLTDAELGEPADVSTLHWTPLASDEDWGMSMVNVRPVEVGRFEFRVPIGRIRLGSFGSGYTSLKEHETAHAGANVYHYSLYRECPLTIVFLDGETPVPLQESWYPSPQHLDGEGRLLYISRSGRAEFRTGLSEPGRYLFELPALDGFEPIPDQTITVQRGERTRHEVQLLRKQ